jgi:hypothetical protein
VPGRTIAEQPFAGDDGSVARPVADAMAGYANGTGSEHAALTALAAARLLVPIVAVVTRGGDPVSDGPAAAPPAQRAEKASEMALPTLIGQDGRRAVLAFTGLDAITRWRPDARPVPVPAGQVFEAALAEADAVVIDVAGPVPLAIDGARLVALATGGPLPRPHEDPDVIAVAHAAAGQTPGVTALRLLPGRDGSDLTLELSVTAGVTRQRRHRLGRHGAGGGAGLPHAAEQLASTIIAGTGGRLRRGISVTLVAG